MDYKFKSVGNEKSSLLAGTLYAIDGLDGYIYYGQIAKDKSVGVVKLRTTELSNELDICQYQLMTRVLLSIPSLGRALRIGAWKKI